jgi:3-phenylpropionate/trans-cinnamate dioxygenase ferredoxin reductase component
LEFGAWGLGFSCSGLYFPYLMFYNLYWNLVIGLGIFNIGDGIMPDYKYLIIGGGITADAAVKGIRQTDSSGKIGIISSEKHPPYNRPPLSKALWKGESLDTIWRNTPPEKVDMHLSRLAINIDTKKKIVVDDHGKSYSYDKLLLATGGMVRTLPYKVDDLIYFRTLDDYQNLRNLAEQRQNFAVIGGGFIGAEIASALVTNNKSVTMIFPEEGIGARIYPPALAQFLNTFYRDKGVELLVRDSVINIEKHESTYLVRTKNGRQLKVDGIIAGIGIQPNVQLAQAAGLKIDNGILVNEILQTSHPDIYAAGDVANFYNPALDKRIRVEHEDNAITMGEIAGKNMAGNTIPYHHLPFFYSDLFELGYEAVGDLDTSLEMIEDWKEPFREGVVYYLQMKRVRGVLLWNTWGQVDAARNLIAEKGPFNAQNIKGRLPV